MIPASPSRSLHRIRWGIVFAAIALAVALTVTSFRNYRGVRDASAQLARGQASALIDSLRSEFRNGDGPPTNELLEHWLEDHHSEGARYVALGADRKRSAGVSLGIIPSSIEPGISFHIGEKRIIVTATRKPRRFKRKRRKHRRGPFLTLEFEPKLANQLKQRAMGGLLLNVSVASVLLVTAFLSFGWLRGREKQDDQNAKQHHLASLGEMSAVLAHEIRNPLTALKGHAQLLEERLCDDPKKLANASRIVQATSRLERLTNDLLDFVRTGSITVVATNPLDVLARAVQETSEQRIQVSGENAPASWILDPERMRQALSNLLRNAIEASSSSTDIEASVFVHSGQLVYKIRDHGDGIPAEQEDRIFEAFHTTRTRGTGLGLAVAQRIVLAHQGSIVASNATSGGAVFTITLPERHS